MNRATPLLYLAILLTGCSSAEDARLATCEDASCDLAPDAGPTEVPGARKSEPIPAGTMLDGTGAVPGGAGFSGETRDDSGADPDIAVGSCFDGLDNDDDSDFDCDDTACAALGSCRVGNPDTCVAEGGTTLQFAECEGVAVTTSCLGSDVASFGDPLPWVEGGMLHPGGDDEFDSGLLIGEAVDLTTRRFEVSVTFGAADCAGTACLEGAGVAFSSQDTYDSSTHVRPLVGLLNSGSRNEVSLVLSDEVVATWPLAEDGQRWTLVLRPSGDVQVLRNGSEEVTRRAFSPVANAQLLVFGRNHNRPGGSAGGASIGNLVSRSLLCDMPAAWRDRSEVSIRQLRLGSAYTPNAVGGPSIAYDDAGHVAVAFSDREEGIDRIFTARQGGAISHTELTMAHDTGAPALAGERPHDAGGVRDPELDWSAGGWILYYTAVDAAGKKSIGRAVSDSVSSFDADRLPLISPDEHSDIDHLEMPTVAHVTTTSTSIYVMVVRATMRDESQVLMPFSSTDGLSWERFYGSEVEPMTHRTPNTAGPAFDAHEIASPSLIVRNGAYHLYYSGRRGTRWSIGLLASDELVHFRTVGEDPVLAAGDATFDRLGARGADIHGHADGVEALYVGTDGARGTLTLATREAL